MEKEMSTYSSILAWKIPWTEKPGGLQYMGSQRVGHDWATSLSLSCQGDFKFGVHSAELWLWPTNNIFDVVFGNLTFEYQGQFSILQLKKYPMINHGDFPGGAVIKNLPASVEDARHRFSPWVRNIPWRGKWQSTPVFLGNPDRGTCWATIHGVAKSQT